MFQPLPALCILLLYPTLYSSRFWIWSHLLLPSFYFICHGYVFISMNIYLYFFILKVQTNYLFEKKGRSSLSWVLSRHLLASNYSNCSPSLTIPNILFITLLSVLCNSHWLFLDSMLLLNNEVLKWGDYFIYLFICYWKGGEFVSPEAIEDPTPARSSIMPIKGRNTWLNMLTTLGEIFLH